MCDYDENVSLSEATKSIGSGHNQLEFGNIRSLIQSNDGCFSGSGDGHYADCETVTPASCASYGQFDCTNDVVTASATSISYQNFQSG